MCDIDKMKRQVEALQAKIAEAEKANAGLSPTQLIAKRLHKMFCMYNHTDGCSWYYEKHTGGYDNWEGYAHNEWHERAKNFALICDRYKTSPDVLLEILSNLHEEGVL